MTSDVVSELRLLAHGLMQTGDDQARDAVSRAADEIESLFKEVKQLEKLVYVPGLWRCPKCEFRLIQANLNACDGSVTARDQPGEKCPNCASSLWRVTERDNGNKLIDDAERVVTEVRSAADAAVAAMKTANTPNAELAKLASLAEPYREGTFQFPDISTRNRFIDLAVPFVEAAARTQSPDGGHSNG